MRASIIAIAACSGLIATAAYADTDQGSQQLPAAVQTAAADPAHQMICRPFIHEGQVVNRPICKTREEWAAERTRLQQYIRDQQMKGRFGSNW